MPKDTFHRLADEKKQRILQAAYEEFYKNTYSKASINQIVKDADIPRGSFYQYFDDKKDLFLYVIEEHVKTIANEFSLKLVRCDGDIFECIDDCMKEFINGSVQNTGILKMVFSEPWIFEMIWSESIRRSREDCNEMTGKLVQKINRDKLNVEDEEEIFILLGIIGAIIRDVLDKIFLSSDIADKKRLQKIFHDRIRSLRRHYTKIFC